LLTRGVGIFLGYHRNRAATEAMQTNDRWLRTGDTGRIDADGQLRVIDRVADVGRLVDGTQFTPKFIENNSKFFPYIKEALVVGDGRNFVGGLVNIDTGAVDSSVERQGDSYTGYRDFVVGANVRCLLATRMAEVNQDLAVDQALAGQAIRRFILSLRECDADAGEMTRMRKLRRHVIVAHYAELVDALYSDRDVIVFRGMSLAIVSVEIASARIAVAVA